MAVPSFPLPTAEFVGKIHKAVVVGIRTGPIAPIVTADGLVQIEHAGAAAINVGLRGIIDEVVIVNDVVIGTVAYVHAAGIVRDSIVMECIAR